MKYLTTIRLLLLSLLLMIATSFRAYSQQLSYSTVSNSTISLTIDNDTITVKNLTNKKVKVLMANTIEDTLTLNSHSSQIVHQVLGTKLIAALAYSGCNCWLQLVTDCSLLPIRVDNIVILPVGIDQVKVEFDAWNSSPGQSISFFIKWSKDNGITYKYVLVHVIALSEISQHYSQIVKLN